MIEVLWHGRGGQGAFTAARLLGAAASMADGSYALAFPSFGPERRGAPMRAFTKFGASPIGDRSAIAQADYVVYLDDTLLDATTDAWRNELKPGGVVLVNSVRSYADARILAIDANGLSKKVLGRVIPNTVFLGALSVLCDYVREEDVVEAIRQYMPAKLHAKNEQVVEESRQLTLQLVKMRGGRITGGESDESDESELSGENASNSVDLQCGSASSTLVVRCGSSSDAACCAAEDTASQLRASANVSRETFLAVDTDSSGRSLSDEVTLKGGSSEGASSTSTLLNAAALDSRLPAEGAVTCGPDVLRAGARIPMLRTQFVDAPSLDPAEFARTTCYPAGHLTAKNAGWRNVRPVIDESACTGCLQCYLYCPDGTVMRAQPVAIDYDFCKGCGVCARACRFNAIRMIPESEAIA